MRIGVIAEGGSDVDVLYELSCKLMPENSFAFKKFVGQGCGKLRKKCTAWAQNLMSRGCSHLVVLHDLDENDEDELRKELSDRVSNVGFSGYVVLIPVREIEAWLLVDATALRTVFRLQRTPTVPRRPETVSRPKEKLRDIVWGAGKKRYVNTIHNRKIAAQLRICRLRKLRSFRPYPRFLDEHMGN